MNKLVIERITNFKKQTLSIIEREFDDMTGLIYKLNLLEHWTERLNGNYTDAFILLESSVLVSELFNILVEINSDDTNINDLELVIIKNNLMIMLDKLKEINDTYSIFDIKWEIIEEELELLNTVFNDKTIKTNNIN